MNSKVCEYMIPCSDISPSRSGRVRSLARQAFNCPLCLALWTVSVIPTVKPLADMTPTILGKRESSAKFDTSIPVNPYSSENGQFEPLLVIECRGLELIDFDPKKVPIFLFHCCLLLS